MRCFTAILLLLMSSTLDAGLVKIIADLQVCDGTIMCRNQTSYGSGAVVGNYRGKSIILSAAHIFEPHDRNGLPIRDNRGKIARISVSGHPASLVGKWNDTQSVDFAILLCERQFKNEIPLGDTPKVGDFVSVHGWDYADTKSPVLWEKAGKFLKVEHGSMGDISFTSGIGVSGGPAIDRYGNMSGILVHSSGVMLNWNFRQTVLSNVPGANLPPPNVKQYTKTVPEPRDIPADPRIKELEQALEKERKKNAAAVAAEAPDNSEEAPDNSEVPPDEESGLKEKAGTVLNAAQVGLSFADRALSNPFVLAALGATGLGTGLVGTKAGIHIGSTLLAWRRRRKKKKGGLVEESPPETFPAFAAPKRQLHTRDTTEAEQLVRLGRLEGRDPLLDSFMGVTFEDVLKNDIEGQSELTPEMRQYARTLWDRVTSRVESAAPLSTGAEHQDWRSE